MIIKNKNVTSRNKTTNSIVMSLFCLLFCILISGMLIMPCAMAENPSPIKLLYFYSDGCEECEYIQEFVLDSLQKTYDLEIDKVNVDDPQGYELLLMMEEITGDSENPIPAVFIGNKGLGGLEEIESELEFTIQETIEAERNQQGIPGENQGSPAYDNQKSFKKKGSPANNKTGGAENKRDKNGKTPSQESLTPSQKSPGAPSANGAHAALVYGAYFSKQGCKQCDRAQKDLDYLMSKYPNFIVRIYDIFDPNSKTLNEALSLLCKVPEKKRLTTPAIFIGDDFLLKESIRVTEIEKLIIKYANNPVPPPWERVKGLKKKAEKNIINRFYGLRFTTIIAAGLLDGINPCAFATIIFFISYLAYIGRKGKDILLVGGAFTFSVFITYMLIGLGFLSFIKSLSFLPLLSKIVYIATAIFALVLGIMSLKDYFICRSGNVSDMTLQLPDFLKKRIHKTIRSETKLKRYVLGALITGFIISLLELACTGQVYLPTIIFVSQITTMRTRSILYLLFYNLMFIFPLCVIFTVVYKGTTSQQLTAFFKRSSAPIKLGTSIFFFTLAAILLLSVL